MNQPPTGLIERLREIVREPIPLPGSGRTAERFRRLYATGREDLSLARLAEAHWDALAILAEAGCTPHIGALYGVWAAETPTQRLCLSDMKTGDMKTGDMKISGIKPFCSGAGLLDRALVTVLEPVPQLVDVDLRAHASSIQFDESGWHTAAFACTHTSTASFDRLPVEQTDVAGAPDFYLQRPGFWHGACGPAACWAGGAAGLVDWAMRQPRADAHTLAHLGAMEAAVWSMQSALDTAGTQIDASWDAARAAHRRALIVRHTVEQACTDILRRFARAFGPRPLAFDAAMGTRYQELDLYVRQSHAERDLEALGTLVRAADRA